MEKPTSSPAPIFMGQEHTITLPSGRVVKIRETNGADDEVLSNMGQAASGDSIFTFLANIILADSTMSVSKPLVADLLKWPVSDRYYLLFKQRLFNQGNTLKFKHVCQNNRCSNYLSSKEVEWEFDLNEFDADLSKDDYTPANRNQPRKYPNGNKSPIEFTTSSGKLVRFKILNGEMEKAQLALPLDKTNKNTQITMREFELQNNNEWHRILSFHAFSTREMSDIRKTITEADPLFDPNIDFICEACKTPYSLPLLALPTFYWPEDMM